MRVRVPARSLVVPLVLALAAPAPAGVRTRALPPIPDGVEPSLAARASAAAAEGTERIHAIVRVPREGRAAARDAGVGLLRAIDGDLWLASVPAAALRAGRAPEGVASAWDLGPGDRLAPELASRVASARGRVALRVKVFEDAPFDAARDVAARAGGTVVRALPRLGILDVEIDVAAMPALLAKDAVRWVEPAPPPPELANNGLRADAWINPVQALGLSGAGVVLGMWDSGLPSVSHPDLAGRVTAGQPGLLTTLHPTHVAGVAIGNGANSQAWGGGGLQWRGVATTAGIVAYDLFDALAETDSAIAIHGIDLSTNSWVARVDSTNCGLYGDYASDAPEYDAIVRGIYGKTIPVVFAAGNERDDGDCGPGGPSGYRTLPPPGTAKNVLTVGAHQSDLGIMTPFSSWGPTDDGRMKPDVTASGCQASGDFGITSTAPGGGYFVLCGTSQAAPAVAGSIALLIGDWRAFHPADPRPATAKALLGGFAQDRGPAGPDYRFGLGAIHVDASVKALRTATTIEDEVDDLGVDEWPFLVPAGTDTLRVTLAWDDPPGAELADTTLVNDLDLELVGPTSGLRLPLVLNPGTPSAIASPGVNRLDNVEQVRVLAPEPGAWIARVRGTSVPAGPQGYSLVGFDRRPPADPAALVASAVNDTTVAITWIRAGDSDRAGTLVVRSISPIAWSPADGTSYAPGTEPARGVRVVASDDMDRSAVALLDAPLPPGTVLHYALFSYDEVPNYSPGVADTARTSTVTVAAPEIPPPARIRFARVGGHPAAGPTAFRLELPERLAIEVVVFDAAGRRVTVLVRGERDAGSHVLAWDGRDAAGAPAAAGVYFVRLRARDVEATEKVVRVR